MPQARLEQDGAILLDPPARRVERRLGIVAVIDHPQDDLEVRPEVAWDRP